MKGRLYGSFLFLLLLAACGEKEHPLEPAVPAVRLTEGSINAFQASFTVNCVNTVRVLYGVGTTEQEALQLDQSVESGGTGPVELSIVVSGLTPLTDYILCAKGLGPSGEEGNIQRLSFSTVKGPDGLYAWEAGRSGPPSFADLSLVTMGWHNANPPAWTPERFASHLCYTDENGQGHWLFDAFLCIDGYNGRRGQSYCIANGRTSAGKDAWQDLLDAWLGDDGALRALDRAIAEIAGSLGAPPRPRYVVMSLPDPVMFQYFSDKHSSTTYWGALQGRQLDFSSLDDQEAAYRWYMDSCRARFQALRLQHVELAGFYILSEELPLDPAFFQAAGQSYSPADTWNFQYKHWEQLVPWVASYAHACNEGLWWIPYHLAPGYRVWRQLGFDDVWMQPNYYWDHGNISHPLAYTKEALTQYRMGIELEFEYSLVADIMKDGRSGPDSEGAPTFYLSDVPMLRERVREYMQMYKDSGLYGVKPIAVYSGTDAFHQLAGSPDLDDQKIYRDICAFILGSPLKR